jgi:hypothetical protein
MRPVGFVLAAFTLWAYAGIAAAQPDFAPHEGTQHLRYESAERAPGQPDRKYRVDFDLRVGRDHGVVAVVRHAMSASGDTWTDASVAPACAPALHAHSGELARVTLWPISPAASSAMNEDFLAMCAPAAVFYPISDILNVVLVQVSPEFKLASLHAAGDQARTQAYATHFERLGAAISVSARGGETRLTALTFHRALVTWTSDAMDLTIIHRGSLNGQDLTLSGQEDFAFQLEVDPRNGKLIRAQTTSDQLDLVVQLPNLAPEHRPHIAITREVIIEPLHQ